MTSSLMPRPTTPEQLLGFSVHASPQPDGAVRRRTWRGRGLMLIVWLVCAAPVVASYLSYYVFKPQGRSNHGTLITPPAPMPAHLPLLQADGRLLLPQALKGQWLLVVVADGACDADCERLLYLQRQLRETLGKDKERVDRVWLVTGDQPARNTLMPAMQQAWVLRTDAASLSAWLKPEAGQKMSAHVYLIDPRGDWMMRWPGKAQPADMKKDLTRLLKASESWDEAGR